MEGRREGEGEREGVREGGGERETYIQTERGGRERKWGRQGERERGGEGQTQSALHGQTCLPFQRLLEASSHVVIADQKLFIFYISIQSLYRSSHVTAPIWLHDMDG